jgi:hypothetical protein
MTLRKFYPDENWKQNRFVNVAAYTEMIMDRQNRCTRPGCVSMEEAAAIFGWPNYYLPFMVQVGHLKPLGKPAQNARKWFATVEIERLSQDPDWLDKTIRIVEKQIQEMNKKQRGKKQAEKPLV